MQRQILSSSLWMLGGNSLQQVLQFVIFILLARYLSPEIFGYVALASVTLDIAGTVGKWGISDVILQRRRVTTQFLSHAFVFSMALALAISLLILAGIGIFVALKGFTLIAQLMLLLIPIMLFQAAEMVPEAMVRRRIDFKWLAMRNNMSALFGGLVALVLAYIGMGVYALVAQRLVSLATLLVMVWIAAGDTVKILPLRKYNARMFGSIAKLGGHMVSSPLTAMLGPRANDLLIGLILGPGPLGLFKITRRIFDFVAQLTLAPLSSVAQAAFPQLMSDPEELKQLYRRIQDICALALFPLLAGLGITARLWVPLLLGDKWNDAIILVQWSALGAVPQVVNYFQLPLLIAFRANSLIFRQNAWRLFISVASTGIGVWYGVLGVIQLLNIQLFGFMVFNWVMIRKIAGWSIRDNVSCLIPATVSSLGMLAVIFGAETLYHPASPWMELVYISGIGAVSYIAFIVVFFRRKALAAAAMAKKVFMKRGRAAIQPAQEGAP